jgi:hypothetical protein
MQSIISKLSKGKPMKDYGEDISDISSVHKKGPPPDFITGVKNDSLNSKASKQISPPKSTDFSESNHNAYPPSSPTL